MFLVNSHFCDMINSYFCDIDVFRKRKVDKENKNLNNNYLFYIGIIRFGKRVGRR